MSSLVKASNCSFQDTLSTLLKLPPPLLPPSKASDLSLTDQISSLYVHPCLEAALHILNCDLPSAHFLCRHMQAAPEYEGMFLHGILHRIEGDYDNARAWYRDVAESSVFKSIWEQPSEAYDFISRVEALKNGEGGEGLMLELARRSVDEIKGVIKFCVDKYGEDTVQDASTSWSNPEGKLKELGQEMTSGSKGFRQF